MTIDLSASSHLEELAVLRIAAFIAVSFIATSASAQTRGAGTVVFSKEMNVAGRNLRELKIVGYDLTKSTFDDCDLTKTVFTECTLDGAR